jgi:hypothetical protein
MFEEIPSPPAPPSQRTTIVSFGMMFAIFLIGSAIAWFRWSGPLSLGRKITAGDFLVGGVLSGVFLLTAKSTSPEGNQKRMWALFFAVWLPQLIVDVLRSRLSLAGFVKGVIRGKRHVVAVSIPASYPEFYVLLLV